MKQALKALSLLFFFAASCGESGKPPGSGAFYNPSIKEHAVERIQLSGRAGERDSEISGLAWMNDYLLLMPQYPFNYGEGNRGIIFALEKQKIIDYLASDDPEPILPLEIPLEAEGLEFASRRGSGFESVAVSGESLFVTIESYVDEGTTAYLAKGYFSEGRITLLNSSLREIVNPANRGNFSQETLLIYNERLISISEVNGRNLFPAPFAVSFDLNLIDQRNIPMPGIEYRITDATRPDTGGVFWVINYYWPGEEDQIRPAEDEIMRKYGVGGSHSASKFVERLIELRLTGDGIVLSEKTPVYLDLEENKDGRNWEGIVKFDGRGFIIVTDKFPETILAFVKF